MKARRRETEPVPEPVACVLAGGCSYMRAVAKLENLAGFPLSAEVFASGLTRCRENGCWAAAQRSAAAAPRCANVLALKFDPSRMSKMPGRTGPSIPPAAPIAFDRTALVDALADHEGNYVERRPLKLEALPSEGDPLGALYDYWKLLRGATECRFANIDTVQLERAGVIGRLHVVDVSSSDPEEFRFELFGDAVPLARFERLRALPARIYAESTMRDYNMVRLTALPRLHRIRCHIEGISHHYTRLVVPLFDDDGCVAHLLVAIREEPGNGVRIEAGN